MYQKFASGLRVKISRIVKNTPSFVKKHWFILFVVLVYVFMSAYYMGPAFTDCKGVVHGIGDSTGGPIWRGSLKPEQPLLGGYERVTNYPEGESLYSPVNYATLAQTASFSAASEVVGPICSYNLSNIFGYLTTGLLMFAFIFYLTKSRWIGLLAGYAVAFTPYIQSKIGGHPSYAYGALLIAIIWLILHTIKTTKKRYAILLAIVLGICAYFDPYFILLAATVALPMLSVWLVFALRRVHSGDEVYKLKTLTTFRAFLVGAGVFMVLVSPLLVVSIKDRGTISSNVSAVRGNVFDAAMLCSNKPLDYILPDPLNIPLQDIFGANYTARNIAHRNWCGYGESRVSISLTMLAVILLGAVILLWERVNRRRTGLYKLLAYDSRVLLWSVGLIGLTAFLIGLPPHVHGLKMPSDLILKITQTWRIFAREYLVVNIAVVVLCAVVLKYFSSARAIKGRTITKALIFMVLTLFIGAEYQITTPFNPLVFKYSRDVPSVYYQVKNNKDIKAIAEYPIDRMGVEHDSIVYYVTMQAIHGKGLFNSAIANSPREDAQVALKDITDPQTLPALRYMGIRYIVIHGLSPQEILSKTTQLQILGDSKSQIYSLQIIRSGGTTDSVLAKITNGPKVDNILTISKGYMVNLKLIESPMNTEFETLQDTQLKVTPLFGASDGGLPEKVCFDAKMAAPQDSGDLTVSVNGVPQVTSFITGTYSHFEVMARKGDTLLLHNSKGYNVRLNNLGCTL